VREHTRAADVAAREEDGTEREIEAVVAAADESRDPHAVVPGAATIPSFVDLQRLVSGLTIQRTAAGGLVVEAPPETASTLAALFSGMAQLFQQAAVSVMTEADRAGRNSTQQSSDTGPRSSN
jgi:hypothetical protein